MTKIKVDGVEYPVVSFHIEWNNHLKFKDEIDPHYYSPTGLREVVSLGRTISGEFTLEDGRTIKVKKEIDNESSN